MKESWTVEVAEQVLPELPHSALEQERPALPHSALEQERPALPHSALEQELLAPHHLEWALAWEPHPPRVKDLEFPPLQQRAERKGVHFRS
jgi:hypothetical protein